MTRGSRRVLGVAAALALGVLAAVPGLLSSACGGGLSRAAFEERFAENDADRLRAVLDKLGAPSPAKVPANATGRPVVVGITETSPRKLIAFDVQAGRKLWEAAVAAQTRPSIAGDVAVVLSGHDVVAVGLADGRTRFRFGDEGLSYLGAAFADGTVALVLGSNVPQNAPVTVERKSIVVAVDLASGAVRWRAEVPREIGAPAAAGGLFFFPWDRQYLTAVEPRTGREVARVRTTDDIFSFVWAGPEGVVYGANNLYRLSTKSVGGTKADTPHYALPLKGLPREPRLSPDAYAQPTVEFSARERIRLHWGAAAGAVADRVTLADDTLYFLFYRYLFAYAAGDGRLRWVHKAPRDIVTLGIGRGGVVLVGEEGDVAFVDSDAGTVVGR